MTVDVVEGRVAFEPELAARTREPAEGGCGLVAPALDAELGSVDLDEANTSTALEQDRVAVPDRVDALRTGSRGRRCCAAAAGAEERRQ